MLLSQRRLRENQNWAFPPAARVLRLMRYMYHKKEGAAQPEMTDRKEKVPDKDTLKESSVAIVTSAELVIAGPMVVIREMTAVRTLARETDEVTTEGQQVTPPMDNCCESHKCMNYHKVTVVHQVFIIISNVHGANKYDVVDINVRNNTGVVTKLCAKQFSIWKNSEIARGDGYVFDTQTVYSSSKTGGEKV